MKKIIITSDGNIPSIHAHSFNVMKMVQGFTRLGLQTQFVGLLTWPLIKERLKYGAMHKHYGIDRNLNLKFIPILNHDFLYKKTNCDGFSDIVAHFCKNKSPDVVYCRSTSNTVSCVKYEIPCLLEAHTTHVERDEFKAVCKISSSKYFLGLVTISDILKKLYTKQGIPENKIFVVEDGADLKNFDISDDRDYWRKVLDLPKNKKILVYSGSLYKEKGIENILKTYKLLLTKNPNVSLVLVGGSKSQVDTWQEFCRDNQINEVIFVGFQANVDIPKYLKSADVLLMPYDTSINYNVMDLGTTSPLKLFDYMASKRPILTTNIPTISKVVKHLTHALLARENDIEQQVNLILDLLKDQELSQKLANNAYKHVQKYSWTQRCADIIEYYGL